MPQRASVVDLGAGCLGHWPVGIQNREHVADAGLAVGSDRRRWASIMTRAYFRGCGGGESDMADDDFALNGVLRQQAS